MRREAGVNFIRSGDSQLSSWRGYQYLDPDSARDQSSRALSRQNLILNRK